MKANPDIRVHIIEQDVIETIMEFYHDFNINLFFKNNELMEVTSNKNVSALLVYFQIVEALYRLKFIFLSNSYLGSQRGKSVGLKMLLTQEVYNTDYMNSYIRISFHILMKLKPQTKI
ncbi:hypothetical protein Avbf_17215 [Armadillidium vulgare]|nr:hypothetical protein Avbf_17215 [Armadillidium vulgare]